MTDHADLTARLREHADRVAGGGPSDPNYDPETLSLEHEAADLIDSLTRERDEALAEVAQLRAERSAALALLDIHAKDPFHPDVRAALRGVLAVSEEATDG